ncbi:MAG: hypothetical protein CSA70_09805 [Rhodobacterales bacterium]|nr:MAG: hypothetical protein CSA70_09805 [Rhodobacterales bacterium]
MNDFEDLRHITETLYQRDMSALQAIVAEENALRADLAKLDDQMRVAEQGSEESRFVQRSIGADILWRGWVERTRATLQMRLAGVMARKGEARLRMAKSHGKAEVARELSEKSAQTKMRAREARISEQIQDMSILTSR